MFTCAKKSGSLGVAHPKFCILKLRSFSSCRAMIQNLNQNIFWTDLPRLRRRFYNFLGVENAAIFREKIEKLRAFGVVRVIQSHLQSTKSCTAFQIVRKSFCNRIFSSAALFSKFSAPKLMSFSAKIPPTARIRRRASQILHFEIAIVLVLPCNDSEFKSKHFLNRFSALEPCGDPLFLAQLRLGRTSWIKAIKIQRGSEQKMPFLEWFCDDFL